MKTKTVPLLLIVVGLFLMLATTPILVSAGGTHPPLVYNPTPSDGELLVVPDGSLGVHCSIDSPNGSAMMERCWTNASGSFVWSNWAGPFTNTTINWNIDASSYATTYYWGVYANDSFGDSSNTTFSFTTRGNYPPVISNLGIPDASINQDVYLVWNCSINDTEGFSFDWNISCSSGDSVIGTYDTNGTKTCVFPFLAYNTTYTVWVNVTEDIGGLSTNEVYTFTTKNAPVPPSPDSGSLADAIVPAMYAFIVIVFILGLVGLVLKSFERWGR